MEKNKRHNHSYSRDCIGCSSPVSRPKPLLDSLISKHTDYSTTTIALDMTSKQHKKTKKVEEEISSPVGEPSDDMIPMTDPDPTTSSKKTKKTGEPKKKHHSRSYHAGIQFPVGRVDRHLRKYAKQNGVRRVNFAAPVYLAGVLEYMADEVLELAGNAAREFEKKRITPDHIHLAFRHDEELNNYIKTHEITFLGEKKTMKVTKHKVPKA